VAIAALISALLGSSPVAIAQTPGCTFTGIQPAPGSTIQETQPQIGVPFQCTAAVTGQRVTLDGAPVTAESGGPSADRGSLFFQPQTALAAGQHTVRVELTLAGGATASTEFRFTIAPGGLPRTGAGGAAGTDGIAWLTALLALAAGVGGVAYCRRWRRAAS
jgi:hypothetical protein